jgi:acetylornithine/succinyldiaminopimelate/putrescine aminotransferase
VRGPAGGSIVRLLPPLNITNEQGEERLALIEKAAARYSG